METTASILKALGHTERLRIVALLSHGELSVSELTQILALSQPRVTQYIKTLETAGIIERLKEGSWVFSRLARRNQNVYDVVKAALAALPHDDKDIVSDYRRLTDVRQSRAETAQAFFASVAQSNSQLDAEYLPRGDIETHMRALAGEGPFDFMVDLGTGTGRILEVFADRVARGSGIDSNHDMLKVARHNLAKPELSHLSVRHGDLHLTPLSASTADLVSLHQVLHFLDDPNTAILEAGRLLKPGGQVLIVDFEIHDRDDFRDKYAHRRLGFTDADIAFWLEQAGLTLINSRRVEAANSPAVKLWLGSHNTRNAP